MTDMLKTVYPAKTLFCGGYNKAYLSFTANGTVYRNAFIWNTQMKNTRKCSNISVKKYQNTPKFGVRSGTLSLQIKVNTRILNGSNM